MNYVCGGASVSSLVFLLHLMLFLNCFLLYLSNTCYTLLKKKLHIYMNL